MSDVHPDLQIYIPRKLTWNLKFEEENHLNQTFIFGAIQPLVFKGVDLVCFFRFYLSCSCTAGISTRFSTSDFVKSSAQFCRVLKGPGVVKGGGVPGEPYGFRLGGLGNLREDYGNHHPPLKNPITVGLNFHLMRR